MKIQGDEIALCKRYNMMRGLILLMLCSTTVLAQQYMSKDGYVHFFSEAPMENIEAENKKVAGIIDAETADFAFKLSIEDFQFEKALMQEHFNENYMESDKYPFSTFIGKIKDFHKLDLNERQEIEVGGQLSIHGVTQKVKVMATIWLEEGQLHINSDFIVRLEDHDIDIPKIVLYNIAEEIEVSVKMQLQEVQN